MSHWPRGPSAGFLADAQPPPPPRLNSGAQPFVATRDTPADEQLVSWVERELAAMGGHATGASLGGRLAESSAAWFRHLKWAHGGLTKLLARFPDTFSLADDPPTNSVRLVAVAGSPPARISRRRGGPAPPKPAPEDESALVRAAEEALAAAPRRQMHAVTLANALRDRLGTQPLAAVREKQGGLLRLLEQRPQFAVVRIPKKDVVRLLSSAEPGPGPGPELEPEPEPVAPRQTKQAQPITPHASACLRVRVARAVGEARLRNELAGCGEVEIVGIQISPDNPRIALVRLGSVAEAQLARARMESRGNRVRFATHDERRQLGEEEQAAVAAADAVASALGTSADLLDVDADAPAELDAAAPAFRPSAERGASVRVTGVGPALDPLRLQEAFAPFGSLRDCRMGAAAGEATVAFEFPAAARRAARQMDGAVVGGCALGVRLEGGAPDSNPAPAPPPAPPPTVGEVTARLTSNSFKPRQRWPKDPDADEFYVRVVAGAVHEAGGQVAVNPLRAAVRARLQLAKTVKSLPLRALVEAYEDVFELRRGVVVLR